MNAIEPVSDPAFWTRGPRHMLRFGSDLAGFVPERSFLYDASGGLGIEEISARVATAAIGLGVELLDAAVTRVLG